MAVVVCKNPQSRKGFVPAPKTIAYSGEFVAVPAWVDYPAVALTTGERKFKFRIIPKDVIISIDGNAHVEEIKTPRSQTFTVAGSKGNVYTVSVEGKNKTCTCPAFQFRRSCKHIAQIGQ
jgi:hypothetical protein